MKQRLKTSRLGVGLLLLMLVGIVGACHMRPDLLPAPEILRGEATPPPALRASGVIQAQQISIASEFGGKIMTLPVAEGDTVQAGDVVARFDTALLDAQIEVAQAMVAAAEAGLAQAEAGARPGQLAVARAQVAQAEAGYLAAGQAVSDTLALLENPQDLNLQIAVTRARLEAARHQESEAIASKDAVEVAKVAFEDAYARFDGGGRERFLVQEGEVGDLIPEELEGVVPGEILDNLPTTGEHDVSYQDYDIHLSNGHYQLYRWVNISFPLDASLLPNLWWQAWVGVNAASATVEGLEGTLNNLYAQYNDPQVLQAGLDEACSLEAQLEIQLSLAEIQVEALEAGATPEQLAAIESRVEQAHAGLEALLQQRDMLSLTTPISGTVVDLLLHPGEVAAQGAPLLTVADLQDLELTVYVPENHLGHLWVGQPVSITVDSFPARVFAGQVEYIADRAEFTPRNVATQEERVNLVFAVQVQVANEDALLKPGMPADVDFGPGGGK